MRVMISTGTEWCSGVVHIAQVDGGPHERAMDKALLTFCCVTMTAGEPTEALES
jgi:hypothetical protein